jgi:hypothetical protein
MRQSLQALTLSGFLATSWFTQPVFLDQLWGFLTTWGESSLDEGCGMDPSGSCKPASQPGTDEGCIMDPSGLCRAGSQVDAGCIMDPDGHCRQDPQPDAGCGMDPNGCPQGS